jgi:hypothetical protein
MNVRLYEERDRAEVERMYEAQRAGKAWRDIDLDTPGHGRIVLETEKGIRMAGLAVPTWEFRLILSPHMSEGPEERLHYIHTLRQCGEDTLRRSNQKEVFAFTPSRRFAERLATAGWEHLDQFVVRKEL